MKSDREVMGGISARDRDCRKGTGRDLRDPSRPDSNYFHETEAPSVVKLLLYNTTEHEIFSQRRFSKGKQTARILNL